MDISVTQENKGASILIRSKNVYAWWQYDLRNTGSRHTNYWPSKSSFILFQGQHIKVFGIKEHFVPMPSYQTSTFLLQTETLILWMKMIPLVSLLTN